MSRSESASWWYSLSLKYRALLSTSQPCNRCDSQLCDLPKYCSASCDLLIMPSSSLKAVAVASGLYSIHLAFGDIANYLLSGHGVADPYMCLADFESYRQAHADALQVYDDKERWNRMSLHNIAAAGHFAADRSIKEYADRIWNLKRLTGVK